ncbi:MAG: hypothetical protein PSX37_06775, partial [bacterium]|nr:hypothetical protein [bacterium]
AAPDGTFAYFGLLAGDQTSLATAISADGQTVVGYSRRDDATQRERAFIWTPTGGTRQIPDLRPNGVFTQARGVSASGEFVVGHSNSDSIFAPPSAFIWSAATGSVELPGFAPGDTSEARGVAAAGTIVVGYSDLRAARWTNGVIEDLGLLPGYTIGASANYVSNDGSLIAGSINAPSATGLLNTSFVFSDSRGMQLANDFFAGHGVVLPGTIFAITDMSPDGTAFSVRLYDSFADYVVVIPAAPSALAFAILLAAPFRRRR